MAVILSIGSVIALLARSLQTELNFSRSLVSKALRRVSSFCWSAGGASAAMAAVDANKERIRVKKGFLNAFIAVTMSVDR